MWSKDYPKQRPSTIHRKIIGSWDLRPGVRRKSAKMFGNDFCDLTNFFLTFSITVVLLKEVPEGVENGQNALNKRCRAYPL